MLVALAGVGHGRAVGRGGGGGRGFLVLARWVRWHPGRLGLAVWAVGGAGRTAEAADLPLSRLAAPQLL